MDDSHNLLWGIGIGIGIAAVLITCLGIFLGQRKTTVNHSQLDINLTINISQLAEVPVVTVPAKLELYGTPVQLRVLVLAPIGRGASLPAEHHLSNLLNHFLPDFMDIVNQHHPIFRSWPEQLSTSGFQQSFFNNLSLPGLKGKGTPWCSIAGNFEALGTHFSIGMVFSTKSSNSLSQISIEHNGQWLDVLRIQKAGS